MNLFQNVKYGVSCREAAERYGVSVNRQGKALCPFHNDRHPSLYVADNHYFCFACGAHGDVIDFAADFFDLPLYEAAQRLAAWRAAWADVSNRYLERAGREERIDHRSNAARGIDEIPTIHEGVTAQALERKGIISDRCEINRQIREQNKLIRAIRDEITKLKNTIMTSVPALAKALETARKGILLLRYSWLYHTGAAKTLDAWIQEIQPSYERFLEVRRFLREKSRQKRR